MAAESSGEQRVSWGLRDFLNPYVALAALASVLVLALYLSPLLLVLLDPEYGSLPYRLIIAAGLVPLQLLFYIVFFLVGGAIGPESEAKWRRRSAEALMIFGILPLVIVSFWRYTLRRSSGGDGATPPGSVVSSMLSRGEGESGFGLEKLRRRIVPRIG